MEPTEKNTDEGNKLIFIANIKSLFDFPCHFSEKTTKRNVSQHKIFSDYVSAPVAVVDEPREDFQPVKSRKRKSKETQMESVTDGKFS